jgi:hypothetical protein
VEIEYTPAPTVANFIQEYLPGELFYNFIVGPVGSAKTTGSLFKIPYMASLQAPDKRDGIRRSKCVVVRNTQAQLRDTTLSSFFYWFKDGEAGKWHATKSTFVLKFGDVECEILFRALDTAQDVSRVLSLEVTFAILDEFVQIPKEIVEALSGRCGRYPPKMTGGATNWGMWGSSNPGEEGTYWYDFLVEEKPTNVSYFHQPSGTSPEAENIENLPAGYYTNIAKGKSHSWVKQFVEGEWGYSVAGRPVIQTFNKGLHVTPCKVSINMNIPVVIGYDPGMNTALIFGQLDIYGRLSVIDEMCLQGYGTRRMLEERLIPHIKLNYAGSPIIIAPDPAGNQRSQSEETSVVDVLKDPKYRHLWDVVLDSDNIRNLLGPRIEAVDHFATRLVQGGPALRVDPKCRTLIRALVSGWRYEQTKNGVEKVSPEKNEFSHPGDGLTYLCRYFLTNELTYSAKKRNALPNIGRAFGNLYNQT